MNDNDMEEISSRCVQLKSLPATATQETVRQCLDDSRCRWRYEGIYRHAEKQNDIRWLVLFKTRRDAERCVRDGSWQVDTRHGRLDVLPEYCSDRIVPLEWRGTAQAPVYAGQKPTVISSERKRIPMVPGDMPPTAVKGPLLDNRSKPETEYTYKSRHREQSSFEQNPHTERNYERIDDTQFSLREQTKVAPRPLPPRSGHLSVPQEHRSSRSTEPWEIMNPTRSNSNQDRARRGNGESLIQKTVKNVKEKKETHENIECCKIKVSGFSRLISKDSMEMYFESEKRSGGGNIVNISIKEDEGEAVIEFEQSKVVQRILEKQAKSELILSGVALRVDLFDPQFDKRKFYITEMSEKITKDSLKNFFEARCGHVPIDIIRGATPGTALLVFALEQDFKELHTACRQRPLEVKHLHIHEVEVTRSIKVTGWGDQESEALTFYFENKRRSQGGDVESVIRQTITGAYIVTFVNAKDAERVCQQESHFINQTTLSVSLYFPCLDLDTSLMFTVPSLIQLKKVESHLKRFIIGNKSYWDLLVAEVAKVHGHVHKPTKTDDCIKISCTVNLNDAECRRKVENWSTRCLRAAEKVLAQLYVDDSFHVAKEAWRRFKERLGEISIDDPDKVSVFLKSETQGMVVVGDKAVVNAICMQARTLARELEQQIDAEQQACRMFEERSITDPGKGSDMISDVYTQARQLPAEHDQQFDTYQQTVTEAKRVLRYQIILLLAVRFTNKFKKSQVTIDISYDNNEVIFKGKRKHVDQAVEELFQTINSFVKKQMPDYKKPAIDLLFPQETRRYIKGKLMQNNVIGVWNVTWNRTLELFSKSESDLEVAENVLRSCLKQQAIPLDTHMQAITHTAEWGNWLRSLEEDRKNQFKIEVTPGELFIAAIDSCFDDVVSEVQGMFDLHSILTDFIEIDAGKFRFMCRHKKQEVDDIQKQYSRLAVEIIQVDEGNRKGFKIKGTKNGCKLAVPRIKQLSDGILLQDCELQHPYVHEFINTTEGKQALGKIELSHACVLEVDNYKASSSSKPPAEPQSLATCRLDSRVGTSATRLAKGRTTSTYGFPELYGIGKDDTNEEDIGGATGGRSRPISGELKTSVVIGDLAKQKVDVIVNSCNQDLSLNVGMASRSLLRAGGDVLQAECLQNYPTGVQPGEIAVTSGGAMACRYVFHGVLCGWDDGKGGSERFMEKFIYNCLNEADKRRLTSIAFPALGTGQLDYPVDVVAKLMFDTVAKYQQKHTSTKLRQVLFVIWEGDDAAINVFQKENDKEKNRTQRGTLASAMGDNSLVPFSSKKSREPVCLTVVVYSDSVSNIQRAKRDIEELLSAEVKCNGKETAIKKLEQSEAVQKHCKRLGIEVSFKSSDRYIRLRGYGKAIHDTTDLINAYLLQLEYDDAKPKLSHDSTFKVVGLASTDSEYRALAKKFSQETNNRYTIVKVERIENPKLDRQYVDKQTQMNTTLAGLGNEKLLWHGTRDTALSGIHSSGFYTSSQTQTPYGCGAVFTSLALTSASSYCTRDLYGQFHIYLAYVLVGDYCEGQPGLTKTPRKRSGGQYDSTTNSNTSVFVIYDDSQAYPAYHVVFQ